MFTRLRFACIILFGPYREIWDLYKENASLKSAFKTLSKEADILRWKVEHELEDWRSQKEGDGNDNIVKRDESE